MGTTHSRVESGSLPNVRRNPHQRGAVSPALASLLSVASLRTATRCDDAAPPPPPPLSSEALDSISAAAGSVSAYANPGPFEAATMDAKRLVMLDTYEGFRCEINKQVSPYMAAIHSFLLGTNLPDGRKSTYMFMTQVADEHGLLLSRVDPARRSVDARIHKPLFGGLATAKLQASVSPEGQGDQMLCELDFGGFTWTGNLKYGSMGGGMVYGANYYQAITPKLAMGGEGMYISANQNLLGNYLLKYTMPAKTGDEGTLAPLSRAPQLPPGTPQPETSGSSTICAAYNSGQGSVTLNYKRVVTPNRVTLGAELQFSPLSLDSQLLVGAEFKLQRSKISLCLDGSMRLQSLVEAKIGVAPGSPTLNFSADMDHFQDVMRFGYGINIEG